MNLVNSYTFMIIIVHIKILKTTQLPLFPPDAYKTEGASKVNLNIEEKEIFQHNESDAGISKTNARTDHFGMISSMPLPPSPPVVRQNGILNSAILGDVSKWDLSSHERSKQETKSRMFNEKDSENAQELNTGKNAQDVHFFSTGQKVSNIGLLQTLFEVMPEKDRTKVFMNIINNILNPQSDVQKQKTTTTEANSIPKDHSSHEGHTESRIDSIKKNTVFETNEMVKKRISSKFKKITTTESPLEQELVIKPTQSHFIEDTYMFDIQSPNEYNLYKRKPRNRASKSQRIKEKSLLKHRRLVDKNSKHSKRKFGFTKGFDSMYQRHFGQSPSQEFVVYTTTVSPMISTMNHFDEVVNQHWKYKNHKDNTHEGTERERYKNIAETRYDWNRQSSKESLDQFKDAGKDKFSDYRKKHPINMPTQTFHGQEIYGYQWNIRPRNYQRKIKFGVKSSTASPHHKGPYAVSLPSKVTKQETYKPYSFEAGKMKESLHDKYPNNENAFLRSEHIESYSVHEFDSKNVNKVSPILSNENIHIQRTNYSAQKVEQKQNDKIALKSSSRQSKYDFEAGNNRTSSNEFGEVRNERKISTHSSIVKAPNRTNDTLFVMAKMIQEAIQKSFETLQLGQSSSYTELKSNSSQKSTTISSVPPEKSASNYSLGLKKDENNKNVASAKSDDLINNGEDQDRVEWIDPVLPPIESEKSFRNKQIVNDKTTKTSKRVVSTGSENAETTKILFPSWMARASFTRRTLQNQDSKRTRSGFRELHVPAFSDSVDNGENTIYYARRGRRIRFPSFVTTQQTKKNKSKESKNISAQKGTTTLSPDVDSPYFDYALPVSDPLVW